MIKKLIIIAALVGVVLWAVPEPVVEGQIGYQITASQLSAAFPLTSNTLVAADTVRLQWGATTNYLLSSSNAFLISYTNGSTFTITDSGSNTTSLTIADLAGASESRDMFKMLGAVGIMDGSDTVRGLFVDLTNADHTGSSNLLYGIDIDGITGDAQATEYAIFIGDGWDTEIVGTSGLDLGAGTIVDLSVNINITKYTIARFDRSPAITAGGTYVDLVRGSNMVAMDGSDTVRGVKIDITNADHTGSSNLLYGLDIDGITGDADASEHAIHIGAGWDADITWANSGNFRMTPDSGGTPDFRIRDDGSFSARMELSATMNIPNGSDKIGGIMIDLTLANATGGSNIQYGLGIDPVTGDADSSDALFMLGDGWDYFIDDETDTALGTLTWTTANDKSGNTGSGTLQVFINGTLYHIQLYADS